MIQLRRTKQKRIFPSCRFYVSVLAGAMLVVIYDSHAWAVSPKEDFVEWYAEWYETVPKNYKKNYKQFLNHDENNPLIMEFTNWEDDGYRLGVVENHERERIYRLLVNRRYVAKIEASRGLPKPTWTLKDFALRSDDHFARIVSDFGTSPDLIYEHERVFETPHSIQVAEVMVNGEKKTQVEIAFQEQPFSKPRDPKVLTVLLDESLSWMPIEIRKIEFAGMRTRGMIDGWHQADGTWLYREETSYITRASTNVELLHSTSEWEFNPEELGKDRRDECYLRYYGLPEPAGSNWTWRMVAFILAVVLCLAGYIVFRWRR